MTRRRKNDGTPIVAFFATKEGQKKMALLLSSSFFQIVKTRK
jgi:hypothetical protein